MRGHRTSDLYDHIPHLRIAVGGKMIVNFPLLMVGVGEPFTIYIDAHFPFEELLLNSHNNERILMLLSF